MRFKIVTKWNSNNRGNKKSFKFSLSNSSLICGKVLTGSAGFFFVCQNLYGCSYPFVWCGFYYLSKCVLSLCPVRYNDFLIYCDVLTVCFSFSGLCKPEQGKNLLYLILTGADSHLSRLLHIKLCLQE